MFGIKKLTEDINRMSCVVSALMDQVNSNTKELHHYSDRGITVSKLCQDTKMDISVLKQKFTDFDHRLSHMEKSILDASKETYTELGRLEQKDKSRDDIMKEIIEKQNIILRYINELEKVMSNVELIIDECLPEKTLKLPKNTPAITERL